MMSESELVSTIYERSDRQITALNDSIASLRTALDSYQEKEIPAGNLSRELFAQYPDISNLILTRGSSIDSETGNSADQIVAIITSRRPLEKESLARIERWLKIRLNTDAVTVMEQTAK
jgi:hypothetical protein